MTSAEAAELASALDLDVNDMAICLACLSTVCFELGSGDGRKIAGAITRVAPDLWAEGLELPVRLALRRARERGVPNAGDAARDVKERGPSSRTVRAIIRRLADDLDARAKGDLLKMGFEAWPPRGRL
jgi:hypothetical protein